MTIGTRSRNARAGLRAVLAGLCLACGGESVAPQLQEESPPARPPDLESSVCVPRTCAELQHSCGEVTDGCGATLSCGACPGGQVCEERGAAAACGAPEPGSFTMRWVHHTPLPGIDWTCGVMADGAGATWVVTMAWGGQPALRKLDAQGQSLGSFHLPARDIGTHRCLLAPTREGGVYVSTDGVLSRVSPDGEVQWHVDTGDVDGLAVDGDDAAVTNTQLPWCYFERCGNGYLTRYSAGGELLWKKEASSGLAGRMFYGLAVDAQGGLHTVSEEQGVLTLSSAGEVLRAQRPWGLPGLLFVTPDGGSLMTLGFYERITLRGQVFEAGGPRHAGLLLSVGPDDVLRWAHVVTDLPYSVAVSATGQVGLLRMTREAGCDVPVLEELSPVGELQRRSALPRLSCRTDGGSIPFALAPAGEDWLFASGFTGSLDAGQGAMTSDDWDGWVVRLGR